MELEKELSNRLLIHKQDYYAPRTVQPERKETPRSRGSEVKREEVKREARELTERSNPEMEYKPMRGKFLNNVDEMDGILR